MKPRYAHVAIMLAAAILIGLSSGPRMARSAAGVTFILGPDGRANQVIIDDLNDDEQGTLQRIPN